MKRLWRFVCFSTLPAVAVGASEKAFEEVVLRAPKPYAAVESLVHSLGGAVLHRFEHVDAVAALLPRERVGDLSALGEPFRVERDFARPRRDAEPEGFAAAGDPVSLHPAESRPYSPASVPAAALTSLSEPVRKRPKVPKQPGDGEGAIVAVIDTGVANSPVVSTLAGAVIGGESFVPRDTVSATSRRNPPAGTWVASLISGNAIFEFANDSAIVRGYRAHAPDVFVGECPEPPLLASCFVPVTGPAPEAQLYALKVSATSAPAPRARVLAAMDRALTLKRNFRSGEPPVPVAGSGGEDDPFVFDSLDIHVVNISQEFPTTFAGGELEDLLTLKMLAAGIVVTAAAGTDGFAAMTGGTPGTGRGALTVGSVTEAIAERILRDVQFGPGVGLLIRPTLHSQVADASARGPSADGRVLPHLVAPGVALLAQGTCGVNPACLAGTAQAPLAFVSGSAFAVPAVSAAAALLRAGIPWAKAGAIRNAILVTADPRPLPDTSRIDRGRGLLDVEAAFRRLRHGIHAGVAPVKAEKLVVANLARLKLRPVKFRQDEFRTRLTLEPGQVAHFFVESSYETDRLSVALRDVVPELPPERRNQLFGDEIFFAAVDAPTSFADARIFQFVENDREFVIENPQQGLVRLALQGSRTNAGRISCELTIRRERSDQGPPSAPTRSIGPGELAALDIDVPAGTDRVVFETRFAEGWNRYPTNDIDMQLVDPSGTLFDGVTLRSPERLEIANPVAGTWTVLIRATTVWRRDRWTLRVTADGQRLFAN